MNPNLIQPSSPELSIIVVSYRSLDDVQRLWPTLPEQAELPHEVLVVDNHGADGVAEWLRAGHTEARVIANPSNTGYAGGNNVGLRHARGTYTLLLNPDTELRAGALPTLLAAARAHPDALITPKLLNPGGTVNACGNAMHYTGIVTCRGLNEPSADWRGLHPAPLLSGAAILARTEVLRALGGLDERYWMYHEDTDLSLRARLAGYRLLCAADAEVTHHYRLGLTPTKYHFLERNRLITLYKALEGRTLRQLAPALLLTELATWVYAVRGLAYLRARAGVYGWLWSHRAELRHARAEVQRTRTVSDAELLAGSQVALPLDQLVGPRLRGLLDAPLRAVYTALRPSVLCPPSLRAGKQTA